MTKKMRKEIEPFAKELYRAGLAEQQRGGIQELYSVSQEEEDAIYELFDEYENDGLRTV